jgi:PAS domain S-box-containing protein
MSNLISFRHTFTHLREHARPILVLLILLAAILLTRLPSYLLFHILAELTSIVIGVCVFTIAWNSTSLLESGFLLVLGIGSLYVSGIDVLHALAFKGMGISPGEEANLPTQLWLVARYLQALAFLTASLFLHHRIRRELPFIVFGVLTAAMLASIFVWNIFPSAYIEGEGLTPFKVGSEYAIIAVLLAAMALFWRGRTALALSVFYGIVGSLAASIAAELAFTLYFGVTDTANLLGHLFKITAFYLLYRALVEVAFTRPYDLLLRQLKQSEQTERAGRNFAEVELHACEESYLRLMNNALVGVYQTSLDGIMLFANSEFAHLLSFSSAEEMIGGNVAERYRDLQDRARLVEILKREQYVREFETDLWTRNGQSRHVLMSASLKDRTISGMVLDITERKRAEEKIKIQVEQLAALRAIDIAIISSADLYLTLKIVLEQVIQHLHVDAASVLLLNPHQYTLEYAEGIGFRKEIPALPPLWLGEGFAGRAALERRIVSAVNIAESEIEFRQKQLIEGEDFVSVYTVPLIIKGQVRGVLDIFNRSELHPDQAWLDFLETLAKQTAIAIDNATLSEGLQKSNMDLIRQADRRRVGGNAQAYTICV